MLVKKGIKVIILAAFLIMILWIVYGIDAEQDKNLPFKEEKSSSMGLEIKNLTKQETTQKNPQKNSTPFLSPIDTSYPEPDYKPTLRPYKINKDNDIWHAQDPISYITPQNEWVRYYASQLYLDFDGRIRYKYSKIPWVSANGRVTLWIDKPFLNNYRSDDLQFNYPPNGDMWVMPDYYLTNSMSDDCDGWAVTVASLLLSGEISINQSGRFVKQVIPAKVVLGYINDYRDAWVEYKVYGKIFYTSTSLVNSGFDGKEKISSTVFVEKKSKTTNKGVFEFTDNYFGEYTGNFPDINKSAKEVKIAVLPRE